ncbi:sterol desaturase [Moraxella macacae 0408225]|uniref:Sterol desaturase n=1 Tax=Moraxella macacae 0408225 TaxID=1230338 RepID=L2F8U0_9GAMM|nr:sterol desaturase family protein [Moraxella macacae]ELA09166.1 sterol desaturase [Moraxella macacae 0408225]
MFNLPLIDEYLFSSSQRLYWGYLASAAVLALMFYGVQKKRLASERLSLSELKTQAKNYWLHPQSILDYQYFVVVWLIKSYLLVPLLFSAKSVASLTLKTLTFLHAPFVTNMPIWAVSVIYTLLIFIAGEFSRYWLHRWLHTVGFLWHFHKVHHSATQLNPLTFYRVHPVENLLFGLRYALSVGIVTGLCLWLFGTQLNFVTIFGANALVAIFSLIGGNLRHSHIYLRYPKWLEKWFISPAQHQLHHSTANSHKNFGGYLGVFDWWHNTHAFSTDFDKPQQFGLKNLDNYRSVKGLLLQPFVDFGAWYAKRRAKTVHHFDQH